MLFKKGDIVVTDRQGMEGISMVVKDVSNELHLCECEYWCGNFTEDFRFDELTVIVEAED